MTWEVRYSNQLIRAELNWIALKISLKVRLETELEQFKWTEFEQNWTESVEHKLHRMYSAKLKSTEPVENGQSLNEKN